MDDDPYFILDDKESYYIFMCLCTFIYICENKKISISNIFILCLKNEKYRNLFFKVLDLTSTYDIVSLFIKYVPKIDKSRYVFSYLKKNEIIKL